VIEHFPTPQSRTKVIGLACNAIRQDRIAKHLGINPKTLRKHYHEELTFGMEAIGAQAAGHLIRLMKGNGSAAFSAVKYFLSCRCHWLEKPAVAADLKLPELRTITDAQAALSLLIAGTARGAILADEAATLASIISSFVKTVEVSELESRLVALEKAAAPAEGRAYDA
jgi:hypothetical protein